jgi:hypothetical protein
VVRCGVEWLLCDVCTWRFGVVSQLVWFGVVCWLSCELDRPRVCDASQVRIKTVLMKIPHTRVRPLVRDATLLDSLPIRTPWGIPRDSYY